MNEIRMLPENPSFLVRGEDGAEYGPVDLVELREWVRENRAGLGTEVRRDEPGATWNSWQAYPELIALLAETQATYLPPLHPVGGALTPVWRRAVAWVADLFLVALVLNPINLLLDRVVPIHEIFDMVVSPAALQAMPTPLFLQFLALVVIENAMLIIYLTICHAGFGKTPAQAMMRMHVINAEGEKPTVTKAFIRAFALVFSVNFYVPLVYVFLNPQRRSFHDLVADTYVVNS